MKTVGIICEFNPFHNGHKYILQEIKKQEPCTVACVMSGHFMQRGDTAVTDKYTRTRHALLNGADLVAELPAVYACASAELFAQAGIALIQALGCTHFAFGCENPDLPVLQKIAGLHQDANFQKRIQTLLSDSSGVSYPKAVERAASEALPFDASPLLSKANNILAVEYLKAAASAGLQPIAIQRKAVDHDSALPRGNFASASAIRRQILEKGAVPASYMPDGEPGDFDNPADMRNLETALLYKLRSMKPEDFRVLPDVSEGLENRIFDAVQTQNSIKEILSFIKTKRYTHARLRRILIFALLDITKELQRIPVPYIRVLGFTDSGQKILSKAKKQNVLPILTKVSQGQSILDSSAMRILEKDILASDIWSLARKIPGNCKMDYCSQIVKV